MTSGTGALPLPREGSLHAETGTPDWIDHGDGFPYRELMCDEASGTRTWLMRIEPGAYSPPHSHTELEQVYLLEGHFDDGENAYGPGDYIVRAPGAVHSAYSRDGALMLVMYTPSPAV